MGPMEAWWKPLSPQSSARPSGRVFCSNGSSFLIQGFCSNPDSTETRADHRLRQTQVSSLRAMRAHATVALLVVVTFGVAACGSSSHRDACRLAWPVASPTKTEAGTAVTLSDAGLRRCPFTRSQTYTIHLVPVSGLDHPFRLAHVAVGRSGAFSTRVRIPAATPPGPASLVVSGPLLDHRLLCPPNAICARYAAGLDIMKRNS